MSESGQGENITINRGRRRIGTASDMSLSKNGENRRDMMKTLLAISASAALVSCSDKSAKAVSENEEIDLLDYASIRNFLTEEEMAFIAAVSQTIIPKTETGGAIEAGVPETLQSLISVWSDDNFRAYWRKGIRLMDKELAEKGGQSFMELSPEQRLSVLKRYDDAAFKKPKNETFYRDFKSTVSQAYYMSELGATEELNYMAVPGEFKGCVPLSDYNKAWAT